MKERIFTADMVDKTAKKIVIPDSVTYIGKGSFENCENLTNISQFRTA